MGRVLKVFEIKKKRIEYRETIKRAVLDPRITGLRLVVNGGWDWIDTKYGFLKLLISRGQVAEIETSSDLLAKNDYLYAMTLGSISNRTGIRVVFSVSEGPGFASEKRIVKARERFFRYVQDETFRAECQRAV